MKKFLSKIAVRATMMAALVGLSSCEDDLDIQTNYPFEVEVMPVPTRVVRGQTVEIRCHLAKEGDYKNTLYTIRWFLYDGTGSLRMENGTVLQPNAICWRTRPSGSTTPRPVQMRTSSSSWWKIPTATARH